MADDEQGDAPGRMLGAMATPGVADLVDAYLTLKPKIRPALVELARAMAPKSCGLKVFHDLTPTARAAICEAIAANARGLAAEAADSQEEAFYADLCVRWRRVAAEAKAASARPVAEDGVAKPPRARASPGTAPAGRGAGRQSRRRA